MWPEDSEEVEEENQIGWSVLEPDSAASYGASDFPIGVKGSAEEF